MPQLIDNSRPNVNVTNTSTETPVYTITIPGGTLGTTGLVYAVLLGKKVKNTGGVDSAMMLRAYLDGTLMAEFHPDNVGADSPNGISLRCEVWLEADGSTGAQVAHVVCTGSSAVGGDPGFIKEAYKALTKDSTGDLDLEFTWQQAAVPEHSYTSEHAVVFAM